MIVYDTVRYLLEKTFFWINVFEKNLYFQSFSMFFSLNPDAYGSLSTDCFLTKSNQYYHAKRRICLNRHIFHFCRGSRKILRCPYYFLWKRLTFRIHFLLKTSDIPGRFLLKISNFPFNFTRLVIFVVLLKFLALIT